MASTSPRQSKNSDRKLQFCPSLNAIFEGTINIEKVKFVCPKSKI
jgi:hypothetical protein